MTDNLFAGLKVIDCASWIAGPAAATILSDFGADVDQDRAAGSRRSLARVHPGSRQDHRLLLAADIAQQAQPGA